jgi:hypothetical protein
MNIYIKMHGATIKIKNLKPGIQINSVQKFGTYFTAKSASPIL